MADVPVFVLYTDGSCFHGDRIGGWAYLIIDEYGEERAGYASECDTTISRMELQAAIMGLRELYDSVGPADVEVLSDSEYVVRGITDRRRARNANVDLWDALDSATDAHNHVSYSHVKGHAGDYGNEQVDNLAGNARKAHARTNS